MGKQRESSESKRIVDSLNARGHYVWKNHGSIYSLRGLADITGFTKIDSIGIYLETKRLDQRYGLTYQQYHRLIELRQRCPLIRIGVVSCVKDAIDVVENTLIQDIGWWKSITNAPR